MRASAMSDEEKIEEETYSVIFSSLKHPIRRRILRMLAKEPQVFSEILESLSIDSGHLNYHLESLGDLIRRTSDGKYGLSSVGVAAVRLMSGVEEHPPTPRSSPGKTALNAATRILSVLLILALIPSSLFFITYIEVAENPYKTDTSPAYALTILPNQTFEYFIIINYTQKPLCTIAANTYFYKEETPPKKGITSWDRVSFSYRIFIGPFNKTTTISTNEMILDPRSLIHEVSRNVTYDAGATETSLGTGELPIYQPGTYKIRIENTGSELIDAKLGITVRWKNFQRPYFYWGTFGLVLASIYPILILARRILTKG